MNLLVTGGYGFLGSSFLNNIVKYNNINVVVNVDRLIVHGNVKNTPKSNKIRNYTIDINKYDVIRNLLHNYKITHVVHFASENSSSGSSIVSSNINGTHSVLQACLEYGSIERFHYIHTSDCYGNMHHDPVNENTTYTPKDIFAATKSAGKCLVDSYYYSHKLPVTTTCHSNTYGPRQSLQSFIPSVVKSIQNGNRITLYNNGLNTRDWLYVDDCSDALWRILSVNDVVGETFNISGKKTLTNNEVVECICDIMNVSFSDIVDYVDSANDNLNKISTNSTKITNMFGWSPITDFSEGIKKTVQYFTE